ncbi:MAG: hypothetical protein ACRQFF_11495 [Sphaerochaeta sp.]
MKKILLILLSLLTLVSCTTTDLSKNVTDTPNWINNSLSDENELNYIVTATASNEEDAYELACGKMISSLDDSLSLGDNLSYYTQSLIDTLGVKELGLYNRNRYYETKDDDTVQGTFLFTVSTQDYENALLSRRESVTTSTQKIQALVSKADSFYRENKDYKAFDSLVDAYIISRNNDITVKNISPDDLLARCLSILDKTRISVYDFDDDTLSCLIEVTRQAGLFPPAILNTQLKISYSSYSPTLSTYLETESITIPSKVVDYKFIPKNKSKFLKGVLLLEMNLDSSLYKLDEAGYEDTVKILENENKSYLITYKGSSKFEGKTVLLNVYEQDLNQVPIEVINRKKIVDSLEALGAIVTLDESLDSDEVGDISTSTYDYHITFKNEVTDVVEGYKDVVRTAGSMEVADIKMGSVVFDSGPYESISNGDTKDKAMSGAFNSFILKAIFLLKENF